MSTDRTTKRATSLNSGNLECAGETVNERNVVARPSARKRRPWTGRILSVIGLVAAATVFASSYALSGSDVPKEIAYGKVTELRQETIQALKNDTGADPLYVLVVSANAPVVIGKKRGLKEIEFENQEDLWRKQGGVNIRKVTLATFVEFQRNPQVYCFFYTSGGSLKEHCFEI